MSFQLFVCTYTGPWERILPGGGANNFPILKILLYKISILGRARVSPAPGAYIIIINYTFKNIF